MIYLYNCLKDGPKAICEKCSEACRDSPFAHCWEWCTARLYDLLNKPLGGFVFMTVWVGVLELGCCGYAIFNQDLLADCQFPEPMFGLGVHHWLFVQLGFSVLSMFFAPYLQNQIWRELNEKAREPDDPNGPVSERTRQAQSETGPVNASKQDVTQAFKTVFMYDIGVLFYFFVLLASFANCWYGGGQILADKEDCDEKANGFPRYSSWAGMSFVVFVFLYGAAWLISMAIMEQSETLTLRRGLSLAAGAAAAAGKPIPGFPPPQAAAAYHPPQEAARRTERPGGGGLMGNFFGGRDSNNTQGAPEQTPPESHTGRGGGLMSNFLRRKDTNSQGAQAQPPPMPLLQAQPPPESEGKPSCGKSFVKLIASVGLDMMGNATYFFPGVGELGDTVFAPASAVMLKMMYNANGVAAIGMIEELLPGTDIVPTATIAWFLQTCAPNHPVTRAIGINNRWELTGQYQR